MNVECSNVEKEDKILFHEGFQMKINEKVISKRKQKKRSREFTKPAKQPYSDSGNHSSSWPFQGGLWQNDKGWVPLSIGYRSSQTTSVCKFSCDVHKTLDEERRFYRRDTENQPQMDTKPFPAAHKEGLGNCYKRITKMFTYWEKRFAKNQEKSSIGRQVKIFPKQLAENNWKPCYLRNEEWLFNRFPRKSLSKKENSLCKVECKTGNISGKRNEQVIGK